MGHGARPRRTAGQALRGGKRAALLEDERPSACIGCGKCARICPQSIDIPGAMKGLAEAVAKLPRWTEICRQREEAAKKARME